MRSAVHYQSLMSSFPKSSSARHSVNLQSSFSAELNLPALLGPKATVFQNFCCLRGDANKRALVGRSFPMIISSRLGCGVEPTNVTLKKFLLLSMFRQEAPPSYFPTSLPGPTKPKRNHLFCDPQPFCRALLASLKFSQQLPYFSPPERQILLQYHFPL